MKEWMRMLYIGSIIILLSLGGVVGFKLAEVYYNLDVAKQQCPETANEFRKLGMQASGNGTILIQCGDEKKPYCACDANNSAPRS